MSSPTPAEHPLTDDELDALYRRAEFGAWWGPYVRRAVDELRHLREQNDGLYAAIQMDAKARAGVSLPPTDAAIEAAAKAMRRSLGSRYVIDPMGELDDLDAAKAALKAAAGVSLGPSAAIEEAAKTVLAEHTNMGESCENCAHRFPYDSCVACGASWPCAAYELAKAVLP